MSEIRTPPSTDTYRQGWERVFGKPGGHGHCFKPGCTKMGCRHDWKWLNSQEPYVIEKLNKRS